MLLWIVFICIIVATLRSLIWSFCSSSCFHLRDRDEIHFLSRHLASDYVDISSNDDVATTSSPKSSSHSPSFASTPSSPSSKKLPKMERAHNLADDWSFPRTLQRIQLPPGERLTSMEKMMFPFYFHDDASAGNDTEERVDANSFNVCVCTIMILNSKYIIFVHTWG